MRPSPRTTLGVLCLGVVAGIGGTAAMTALQLAEARLRGASGESGPPKSWDEAPAPAQVGERIADGVFEHPLPLEQAARIANVMHWSYGTLWGAGFGLVQGSLGLPVLPAAAAFGTVVWGSDYAILPAMKIYKPAWRYPASTLAIDLGRHLVYGAGVAGTYALLDRRWRRRRRGARQLRALTDRF
jgi:hypothetical protein